MKKQIILSAVAALAFSTTAFADTQVDNLELKIQELQKEVNSLKEKDKENEKWIGEVETLASLGSKITFGLDFDTKMDNFKNKMADGTSYSDNGVFSNKMRLNITAPISEDMKFTGRMTAYKYWADSTVHPYVAFDSMQGRVPSDSSVYLERAYIDWRAYKGDVDVILTMGRQPSSEGLGMEFSKNGLQGGTYDALAFDGAADGIVTTVDLKDYAPNTKLRFAYGKGYQNDNTNAAASNAFSGVGQGALADNKVYGLFVDSKLPIDYKNIVQLGYVKATDITANPMDDTSNVTVGDMNLFGGTVGVFDVSDFSFYAHLWFSQANPNGNTYNHPLMGPIGLMTSTAGDTSTKDGYAVWLAAKYNLPIEKTYLGVEYNHGSKNWLNMTNGATDPLNKLATRGDAYEAYMIHEINRYAFFKLGAVFVDNEYTGSGWHVGAPMEISSLTGPMAAGVVDKTTNYYAQFSLSF